MKVVESPSWCLLFPTLTGSAAARLRSAMSGSKTVNFILDDRAYSGEVRNRAYGSTDVRDSVSTICKNVLVKMAISRKVEGGLYIHRWLYQRRLCRSNP